MSTASTAAAAPSPDRSRLRPPVRDLTSFYLWLALGGAAGGAFNALLAPVIFKTVLEYPIARAYVDNRIQRIYGGASEIMREIIGRSLKLG